MSSRGSEIGTRLTLRTKKFAVEIVRLVNSFPKSTAFFVIGNQLMKSGTSVAANYRAATRGRSTKEFYSKLCIVVEEADETVFWLEILKDSQLLSSVKVDILISEAKEILAIMAKSKKTVSNKLVKEPSFMYAGKVIDFPSISVLN